MLDGSLYIKKKKKCAVYFCFTMITFPTTTQSPIYLTSQNTTTATTPFSLNSTML